MESGVHCEDGGFPSGGGKRKDGHLEPPVNFSQVVYGKGAFTVEHRGKK